MSKCQVQSQAEPRCEKSQGRVDKVRKSFDGCGNFRPDLLHFTYVEIC